MWFGGKGMYAKLLEVLGDEPSDEGYYTDQVKGALNERARPVAVVLRPATPRRLDRAAARELGVPCEPVLAPGEALSDPHLHEIGLAVPATECGHDDRVVARADRGRPARRRRRARRRRGDRRRPCSRRAGDCSPGCACSTSPRFVAGPLGAQVLADLGADVIKVEPLEGEAMRAAAYAVAACQRGKRSVALDLNAPKLVPVVERADQVGRRGPAQLPRRRLGSASASTRQTVARAQPARGVLPRQRRSAPTARARRSRATTRSCRR